MRRLARYLLPLAVLPATFFAQAQTGVSEEQMRLLMQGAAQMQACFANVDQAKLQELGTRAEAVEKELRGLCGSGERDKAQARAIGFAKEFAESDELAQMKECGEVARAMIPHMLDYIEDNDDNPEASTHVCDNL
ncbi:MAG: hypothetical protein WC247_15285 [Porticoccaceae bacterium]